VATTSDAVLTRGGQPYSLSVEGYDPDRVTMRSPRSVKRSYGSRQADAKIVAAIGHFLSLLCQNATGNTPRRIGR
jgi:hypothetical protein